jgi:predicted enzyme related to lactoylglutathione lyase
MIPSPHYPGANPAARTFRKALYDQAIPLTAFAVDDVRGEVERWKKRGAAFRVDPADIGPATIAVFDDICGNWIQICQAASA